MPLLLLLHGKTIPTTPPPPPCSMFIPSLEEEKWAVSSFLPSPQRDIHENVGECPQFKRIRTTNHPGEKEENCRRFAPLYIFSSLLGFNSLTPHLREYARTTIPHPILASANPPTQRQPPPFPTLSFGMQTAKLALLTLPPLPPRKRRKRSSWGREEVQSWKKVVTASRLSCIRLSPQLRDRTLHQTI